MNLTTFFRQVPIDSLARALALTFEKSFYQMDQIESNIIAICREYLRSTIPMLNKEQVTNLK